MFDHNGLLGGLGSPRGKRLVSDSQKGAEGMAKNYSVLLLTSRDPRRLKTPLVLLPFGDQPVLRRTLEAYMSLEPREVILVTAESQDRIQEALGPGLENVTVVSSPEVRGHAGVGLRLGLERLASEPEVLLVGLGDQPLLHSALLRDLAEHYEPSEGMLGVATCQEVLGHPVFIPGGFLSELRAMEPGETHRDLILRHPDRIKELETEETAVLRTVEDPESYKELLAIAGLPEPPPQKREEPIEEQAVEPAVEPIEEPTAETTEEPAVEPTEEPTAETTEEPTTEPTEEPTAETTGEPTTEPPEEKTEEPVSQEEELVRSEEGDTTTGEPPIDAEIPNQDRTT
jgi:CTP:molybdopterin cytidylyltransferase MocA